MNDGYFDLIAKATLEKTGQLGFENANNNLPFIRQSILDLKTTAKDCSESESVLVISGGPSLKRTNAIERIKKSNFKGYIISADGTLGMCLRNGIVPNFILTLDPHPDRIIRWFGDPHLAKRKKDDYFLRQDLDSYYNDSEVKKNDELIELVNHYGPQINLIISTSVSSEIAERALSAKMNLFWWNPLYDDYKDPNSLSRKVYKLTKVPCLTTGGNVGTACWVFAHSVLKAKNVILTGMDFSYPPGINVYNTQYFEELKEIFPDNPENGLIPVYNPYLQQEWKTDPAYFWYAQGFLKMASFATATTYNCTEGGILFGDGIEFTNLDETLKKL